MDTGSFRILATVSHAAVNSGVHASFRTSVFILFFFPYTYPGVEFLGHVVALFLVFWENCILFSGMAALMYIPTSM